MFPNVAQYIYIHHILPVSGLIKLNGFTVMQGNTMQFKILNPCILGLRVCGAYPYDPWVHRTKHGPVLLHRPADLLHVVQ